MNIRLRGYIVPTDWLANNKPKDGWHAVTIDEVPTRSLLAVEWFHVAYEKEFEANPEVVPLGDAWDIPDPEILLLLNSSAASAPSTIDATQVASPVTDPPVVQETLAKALRRLDWPFGRALI